MSEITLTCPKCNKSIEAPAELAGQTGECPYCDQPIIIPGTPIQPPAPVTQPAQASTQKQPSQSTVIYQANPVMFKNNPVGFILAIILCFFGIGFLIFLIWILRCKGQTLIVTGEKITLRKGILSKHTNDVYHEDIKNVQVSQSLFQRLFNVGSIAIASAGTGGIEISISGIPSPDKLKQILETQRRNAKHG
jgi:membrane protein YdbS with pleckstrin-like domain